ncbi:MAG: ATP-binding protein [Bacteroidia bacterium]
MTELQNEVRASTEPAGEMLQIERDLDWLKELILYRSGANSKQAKGQKNILDVLPAPHIEGSEPYSEFLRSTHFSAEERFLIVLALAPVVKPWLLDVFKGDKIPTAFGGFVGKNRAFLPGPETALFVLAGDNIAERLQLMKLFDKDHFFYKDNFISLEPLPPGEPELSGVLTASHDLIDLALRGHIRKPDLRPDFPAKLLSTDMSWDDLVLPVSTFDQLGEIELWLKHSRALAGDKKIGKKLKPGFRALFYGPPGTGKTLSACLIGKKTGRDVYRVDLSTIVSKYIGETEKNLARLFDRAVRKDWILFFDEADALFGKRTNVNDSHDRYANQEVSYLLQRIEYHEGLVILATNLKNNIDTAFLRRFQAIVYFPPPKAGERLLLWQKAFSDTVPVHGDVALHEIAKKYELSGSLILNIVSHSTLRAIHENSPVITGGMLLEGISRELAKEGKTL